MPNRDGLEPGQLVDFETVQRVKRAQREALKHAKAKPKGRGKRKSEGVEDVRAADESGVPGLSRTAPAGEPSVGEE